MSNEQWNYEKLVWLFIEERLVLETLKSILHSMIYYMGSFDIYEMPPIAFIFRRLKICGF